MKNLISRFVKRTNEAGKASEKSDFSGLSREEQLRMLAVPGLDGDIERELKEIEELELDVGENYEAMQEQEVENNVIERGNSGHLVLDDMYKKKYDKCDINFSYNNKMLDVASHILLPEDWKIWKTLERGYNTISENITELKNSELTNIVLKCFATGTILFGLLGGASEYLRYSEKEKAKAQTEVVEKADIKNQDNLIKGFHEGNNFCRYKIYDNYENVRECYKKGDDGLYHLFYTSSSDGLMEKSK